MHNEIKVKRVCQNNQEFYIGTFTYEQVRAFTRYTKLILIGFEEDENDILKPIYNDQVQRKPNKQKVKKISDFLLTDKLAMFPTNIVVSIPIETIDSISENQSDTTIKLNPKVQKELQKEDGDVYLSIIDGQHRIRGIEQAVSTIESEIEDIETSNTKEKEKKKQILNRLLNFELVVTFFIDPTLEYQAMIFSTINRTQTKVPENLVYSLFGLTTHDSPQKTALEIVLALNGIDKSPFFMRINLVGASYKRGEIPPLSQATMVKSIIKNICINSREEEIAKNWKRSKLDNNLESRQFRSYYAKNNDRMIIRILYSFFKAVQKVFTDFDGQSLWTLSPGRNKPTNVLQTNVGYQALLKLLIKILPELDESEKDRIDSYVRYLQMATDIDFIDDRDEKRYPYSSRTINILYDDLCEKIWN